MLRAIYVLGFLTIQIQSGEIPKVIPVGFMQVIFPPCSENYIQEQVKAFVMINHFGMRFKCRNP